MAESVNTLGSIAQRAGQEGLAVGGTAALLQTVFWLFVVVGVILLLAWLLRRYTNLVPQANGTMRILGTVPLGNKERVVLLQAGEKQILLGVAQGNVSTLHVFDEAIVVPSQGMSRSEVSAIPFKHALRNALNKESR